VVAIDLSTDFTRCPNLRARKQKQIMKHDKRLRFFVWIVLLDCIFLPSLLGAQGTKQKVDLLVTGEYVVTMDAQRTIYHDGAVAVKGDTIVAVGPHAELEAKYAASETIEG